MQVWPTVVHASAALHDVVDGGGVTVVVPPDFVDTSIAWPIPALMEPPGAGAAAAAAKAAAGMDETSPSSTTGVGPCVKNPDGGTDC